MKVVLNLATNVMYYIWINKSVLIILRRYFELECLSLFKLNSKIDAIWLEELCWLQNQLIRCYFITKAIRLNVEISCIIIGIDCSKLKNAR